MALTPTTKFIPFDGGLNTYANPHKLKTGELTAAAGVNATNDGYVNPGPSLVAGGVATGVIKNFAYSSGVPATQDQAVSWDNAVAGTALFNARTSSSTLVGRADYSVDLSSNQRTLIGYPLTFNIGGQLVTLFNSFNYNLSSSIRDATTGAGGQVTYLNSSNVFGTTGSQQAIGGDGLRGAQDGQYIYVVASPGSGTRSAIWGVTPGVSATSITLGGATPNDIFFDSAPDSNAYMAYTTGNNVILRRLKNLAITATTTTPLLAARKVLGLFSNQQYVAVICSLAVGTFPSEVYLYDLATMTLVATQVLTFPSFPGSPPRVTVNGARAVAGLFTATTGTTFQLIVEQSYTYNSPVGAAAFTWPALFIVEAPGTNATYVVPAFSGQFTAHGGAAIAGKPTLGPTGPLFPVRTGFQHADLPVANVAQSLFASPNGYLLNSSGAIVAKWADSDFGYGALPQFAGFPYSTVAGYIWSFAGNFPEAQVLASGVGDTQTIGWSWPEQTSQTGFSVDGTTFGTPLNPKCGASLFTIAFTTNGQTLTNPVQIGTTSVVPGAVTGYYDGAQAFEAGFFSASTPPVFQATAGGAMALGTYYYKTVFEHVDANGKLHRSAPSLPQAVTLTGVQNAVKVFIPGCYNTLRSGLPGSVRIRLYRTVVNPGSLTATLRYWETPIAGRPNPSGGLDDFIFPAGANANTDLLSDIELQTYPELYTNGLAGAAALGTTAPPSFDSVTLWQGLVWGLSTRNGAELWFTWPIDLLAVTQQEAPAWNSGNRFNLPAEIGVPLAIAALDDKLIVLGSRADCVVVGTPPVRTTTNLETKGFSSPILLPTPGGLKVRNAVVVVPDGVLFQGTQGFILLDRSLNYKFIGMPVQDITDNSLFGAGVFYPEDQCVIFPVIWGSASSLLYYYLTKTWSVGQTVERTIGTFKTYSLDTLSAPVRVRSQTGTIIYGTSAGLPVQVNSTGTDLSLTTGWVEMSRSSALGQDIPTVGGFGQLWEVQMNADFKGLPVDAFAVTLTADYDYDNNPNLPSQTQTLIYDPADGPLVRPDGPAFRFGFNSGPSRRVRFTLAISPIAPPTAELPLYISGLMLSYGVDDGLSRLGSANNGM